MSYASYREQLCTLDERGVKYYSPLCNGNMVSDTTDTRHTYEMVPPDVGCKVTPLKQPSPQVPQFDDSPSAKDWFKDPTYAQRMAAKKLGLSSTAIEKNPSLELYHRIKTMEKVAGSMLQTL